MKFILLADSYVEEKLELIKEIRKRLPNHEFMLCVLYKDKEISGVKTLSWHPLTWCDVIVFDSIKLPRTFNNNARKGQYITANYQAKIHRVLSSGKDVPERYVDAVVVAVKTLF